MDEVYIVAGHKGHPRSVAEKGRAGRRRRLKGARGRGTAAKDKPTIFGILERGGKVLIRMLDNVQQKTIKLVIESYVRKGSLVYIDEYRIYKSARRSGYRLDSWDTLTSQSVMASANIHRMMTVTSLRGQKFKTLVEADASGGMTGKDS